MRKEHILDKIKDALGITDAEANYAVKELLDRIHDKLEYGSAIKIPKIGIFALTKLRKPDYIYAEEETVLLYKDPYDYEYDDSYSSISLPEAAADALVDKSFSISVHKPVAPIWEKDALAGHSFVVVQKILESKIDGLLDLSEVTPDYAIDKKASIVKIDLYRDAEAKAKSDLEEMEEALLEQAAKNIEVAQSSVQEEPKQEENIEEAVQRKYEEQEEESTLAAAELEGEQQPEEAPNSEYMDFDWTFDEEKQEVLDEQTAVTDELKQEEPELTDAEEPVIEDEISAQQDEVVEAPVEEEVKNEEHIKETYQEEIPIGDPPVIMENEIKPEEEETFTGAGVSNVEESAIENSIAADVPPKEELNSEETVPEEKTEEILMPEDENINDESTNSPLNDEDEYMEEEKKPLSPVFWVILVLMLVFTGTGVYYFYLSPSGSGEAAKKTETAAVEHGTESKKEEKAGSMNAEHSQEKPKPTTEIVQAGTEKPKTAPVKTPAKQTAQTSNVKRASGGTPSIVEEPNDRLVSENVYYNGKEYSVQMSSWRNQGIATTEAEKLLQKGYDAYILKAFVEKFNATYYRVRIGGFGTADEAKRFSGSLK